LQIKRLVIICLFFGTIKMAARQIIERESLINNKKTFLNIFWKESNLKGCQMLNNNNFKFGLYVSFWWIKKIILTFVLHNIIRIVWSSFYDHFYNPNDLIDVIWQPCTQKSIKHDFDYFTVWLFSVFSTFRLSIGLSFSNIHLFPIKIETFIKKITWHVGKIKVFCQKRFWPN